MTSFTREINWSAIPKLTDLSEPVREHLVKTYATLGMLLLTTALGSALHMWLHFGGTLTTLIGLGLMIYLGIERNATPLKKSAILASTGLFQGLSLGPLIHMAVTIDPRILPTAFLATTTIFVCFTLTALFTHRRYWLFLGGLLSSALSWMFLISVVTLFFPNHFLNSIHLYLGLFVFCGYVLFDTQLIVERANSGDLDYFWHALELFIDFVGIFVRVLILLMENSSNKDEEKKKQRNR
eukprot:TRINITY_DN1240_c1_g1_i1.p1 TRINITY_DN1240_c1_g1~~TRINITY_DN1240_c1_g1_i1.p1  ORF type:complete len:239 (+),score=59.47 TRINITY_DN1240_c1_g1_i1:65-781(+)